MSLILNIETALDTASICLSQDGQMLAISKNENPKEHASWLHGAAVELLKKSGYTWPGLQAVSVSIGPGSYTGLRVGLASAKGFCYALNIPLITVGTLEIMAMGVMDQAKDLICPVIDARRMEVYMAVYDKNFREKISPTAFVLDSDSFKSLLTKHAILFCGSGITKLKSLISMKNASFTDQVGDASHLATLAQEHFNKKNFAPLAYAEPLYLKDFYSPFAKPLK